MRFFLYGNGGGIDKVKKELANPVETFESIKDACVALIEQRMNAFSIEDLYIQYYGYDERIEKDVYLIATSRYGEENYIKKHGCPQFISYMVTV